jgi:hypothetical protein
LLVLLLLLLLLLGALGLNQMWLGQASLLLWLPAVHACQ